MAKNVDLGFFNGDFEPWDLEKEYEEYEVESRYFPSKVGGRPAWLDLANLPAPSDLTCKACQTSQLRFLLQIYAPGNGAKSFHRSIFIFICCNNSCWNNLSNQSEDGTPRSLPVLVLRNQLSRENRFYPPQPPEERPGWRMDIIPKNFGNICPVCGCRGDKCCGRCKKVWYCCQSHQKLDWKQGHKQECTVNGRYGGPHARLFFPEGLIEIEEEPDKDVPQEDISKDYTDLIDPNIHIEESVADVTEDEWNEVESGQTNDKASEKFNSRVRRAPQQIIRYQRNGEPLICSLTSQLPELPVCPKCKGSRSFEFQIMPQLLSILGLGSDLQGGIDWGSIYVFTCSSDCEISGYSEEIAKVQNFDQTNLPVMPSTQEE